MKLQLIRNATMGIEYNKHLFLTDPYFAEKLSMPTYAGKSKNPLVDLPFSTEKIMEGVEIILLSHVHSDHFDQTAQAVIPKEFPLLCQPDDETRLNGKGFLNVNPIYDKCDWKGISINRVYGRHGTGEVLEEMGPSSGYLLKAKGEPTVFWAGDTVLCDEVKSFLIENKPDIIIVHACGAEWGNHVKIVMDEYQTEELLNLLPQSIVIAVHMESVDHATVSRNRLCKYAKEKGMDKNKLLIPQDGEVIDITI
ncbi:metal-dependent hydrolase [Oxobacter pfennigii]|uniref:Metal-dependent hydrolase n=1 Tax=Oxobacter pfennigii TaxID=36849 RepID=A0A0P8W6G1_9CLOT|nr:MBL fold metallo-hydrolase [Oxobacter pfennigii]KPU44281.1 metal-dependent hydrolase [Oxobacter pfennigii]